MNVGDPLCSVKWRDGAGLWHYCAYLDEHAGPCRCDCGAVSAPDMD